MKKRYFDFLGIWMGKAWKDNSE